jgi:hypothetical protein
LLTGAHEALHSLFEFVPGAARPVWAAESLPTFFAYQAARRHLSGASLALASEMVSAPAGHALLNAERQVEGGDDSEYGSFYSRGTRFWVAIERVLNIAPNGSGRLAALIQRTNGMEEMDWKNAESIAAFLDRYSGGRAAPIVRCYLVEDSCAAANTPLAD